MSREHPLGIGFLIHDVSRLRRTVVDKALKPLGITRSQSWVLAYLSRHSGSGMMQTELAQEMEVGKVTLGGLIDRLESSGLVERRADSVDRRAKRIHMTKAGQSLVKKMQKVAEKVNKQLLGQVSDADLAVAERVLRTMKQQLIDMEGRG